MTETSSQKVDPSTKRILVIDDDDHIRSMMQTMFELEGFQVKTNRDGRDILKVALDFKPDLIITDLMLPGQNGYDILRSLQTDELTRKTPVIVITGAHKDRSTQDMVKQESNVIELFQKPVNMNILLPKIHGLLTTVSRDEKLSQEQNEVKKKFDEWDRL